MKVMQQVGRTRHRISKMQRDYSLPKECFLKHNRREHWTRREAETGFLAVRKLAL